MNQNIQEGYARVGLNTDNLPEIITPGYLTYALNAINSSFDGQSVSYQNEEGNIFCFILPQGYKCIGLVNISQLTQVWYMLTNPATEYSIIGYVANNNCTFISVLDDSSPGSDLLNFNITKPIHKVEVKTTNCSTQIYFTDKFNPRRYIDLNNLPFKTGSVSAIDTNKMAVQPQFSIPEIDVPEVSIGGNLVEGDYQFAIQYADIRSEGLTSWYSVTNPVRIFLDGHMSLDFNLLTNKSIVVNITGLDTSGLYTHFNLAVIKSINQVISVELVGTFFISATTYSHVYSGLEQSGNNIKLTLSEILTQFDYYDLAGDLTQVDNTIVWADLVKEDDISYQKIWNQVKLGWCTVQVPTGQRIGYKDGSVCANFEGYFRDEVYAAEGCFLLDNGKETTRFHIPGRVATPYDLSLVPSNPDTLALELGGCPAPVLPRWKVYNTGSLTGSLSGTADPCNGVQPYQYGEMSYWESTEKYPDNAYTWGPLANQHIRHHRFPDSTITHIHDQNPNSPGTDQYNHYNHNTYPIGFLIDVQSLYNAIQTSTDLTPAEKRKIVGFKIMRSDRGANKSIEAKGYLFNCGRYAKEGSNYYYANYPFNDVHPDPFIASTFVADKSGDNANNRLNAFQRNRFTFHSPDTHFYQPSGIQGSFLKLETAEYGNCKAHFVQVQDNAGEKLKTVKAFEICFAAGVFSTLGVSVSTSVTIGVTAGTTIGIAPTISPQNFLPSYNAMLEIIDKLIPYNNYGWQYNGIGFYGNYQPVPDDFGNKIRLINYGGYINSGLQGTFGDNFPINNTNRESSVYLSVNADLPFTHEQGAPVDTSRKSASQAGVCGKSTPFYGEVSSYYASIKRDLPGQYGEIFSYQAVDTGTQSKFFDTNGGLIEQLLVFGGDCFINPFALKIKHPFFLKSTINKLDGFDIDYNQDSASSTNTGNVGYPIYYYSTDNQVYNIDNTAINNTVNFFMLFFTTGGIVLAILTAGILPLIALINLIAVLINQGLLTSLGVKITNLECYNDNGLYELGQAYLYAYGVINVWCESEVNVDMRQAYNLREGNFYPNVASDIPDDWLQETNTSIVFDNTYEYNKTFSKQNKETAFTLLRPDWQPNQSCYTNFNNRAIWSEPSSLEETKNNWLIYKPANFFDFPKSFGSLSGIDRLETRAVLVRYENHSQIYNAQATIETTAIQAALGTGVLFAGTQPIDLKITNTGFAGSQNKFFISTENGHVWVDAKRSQILLVNGTQTEELSGSKYLNSKWFSNNLPFFILKSFPGIDIDNPYNGIGITGTYDVFYKRLIITKRDYQLLPGKTVYWDGENFYTSTTLNESISGEATCCPEGYMYNGKDCNNSADPPVHVSTIPCGETKVLKERRTIIYVTDGNYFCDKSWTMSFSFLSNSWISWHSYIPNFYIPYEDYFQAGWNDGNFSNVWDHNSTFNIFQTFRGVQYAYTLRYPFSYKSLDQILQSISDYCSVMKYSSFDQSTEINEVVYFNKAIIDNKQQCSGLLILVPKDTNSLYQYIQYPKFNATNTEILVTKSDNMFNFNQFWDKVIDQGQPIWNDICGTTTGLSVLNSINFDYTNRAFKKYPLRAKNCQVTLIQDARYDLKFISRYILQQTQNSFK